MKSHVIILIFLITCIPIFGQVDPEIPFHKNEVKLHLTDLLNGRYTFGYERVVGNHIGISTTLGYKSKEGLLRLSGLDTDQFKTGDLTYSGFRVVPEFRYYINEHNTAMLHGFYFGAYITFVNLKSEFKGLYTNENGEFPFQYDVKVNTNSLGFMIGYKLLLGKRFYFDFTIAGPGVGNYNFKFTEIVAAPDEFWFDLNDALELISIFDLINADFDFSPDKKSDSVILPSFRYGIALGYSF
jgi:hypothetical protein